MSRALDLKQMGNAKLLVRVPNWVGDAVMCLPALRALRAAAPEAELALLAKPWVSDVFPVEELRCRVIFYDPGGPHSGARGRMDIAAQLRSEGFAAAILFQNAFDAALVSWLAKIPIRAGYSRQGRRVLLTHSAAPPKKSLGHESHYYLEMLRRLGVIPQYAQVGEISLLSHGASPKAIHDSGRGQLLGRIAAANSTLARQNSPIIGISPGATFGTAKRWPAAQFAELARRLHKERGAICIFFGALQEQTLAAEVMALAGVPAVSLAGKTSLAEFIELVPSCDLFVTNDTGTMHVAAAFGVPTLAIFGPTNEKETRPLGSRVEIVTGEAFCRPCKLRHCPIDHRCMNSISVDRVFGMAEKLLGNGSTSRSARASAGTAASSASLHLPLEQGLPE